MGKLLAEGMTKEETLNKVRADSKGAEIPKKLKEILGGGGQIEEVKVTLLCEYAN